MRLMFRKGAILRFSLPLFKGIGILLFLWILSRIDRQELVRHLRSVNPPLLLFSFALIFFNYLLKSIRWHLLVLSTGLQLTLHDSWKLYNIGIFLGNITPGKLGEFGRIAYLTRMGLHAGTATSIALLDRILDIAGLAAIFLLSIKVLFGWYFFALSLAVCGISVITLGGALQWSRELRARTMWLQFLGVLARPRTVAALLALTVSIWIFYGIWSTLIAWSLDIGLGLLPLIATATLAGALSLLPIAPAGLGTREAALLALLAPYGISAPEAVAWGLLMFTSIIASSLPGGYYFMTSSRLRVD